MKLASKLLDWMGVGLLGLGLVAGTARAGTDFDRPGGVGVGIRGGGIYSSSDLDGVLKAQGAAFLRYGIMPKLQAELSAGYGRYATDDDAWSWNAAAGRLMRDPTRTEEYYSHLSSLQLRLLWAPVTYESWAPYVYGGGGYLYYNVDEPTPRRGAWDGIGSTLGVPVGVGVRYELNERVGVEGSGGYTFTFSDKIDESDDGGSNDHYFEFSVGLTYDITLGQYVAPTRPVPLSAPSPRPEPAPAPRPEVKPAAPADQDKDGLTDEQERMQYFTNPLMADSDGDGLDDGSEVNVYRTNPNKADSDGGGVADGDEVSRGTDPLDAADDVVKVEERAMPAVEYSFPVVYFRSGGAALSEAARAELDSAAQLLVANRGVLVEVRGYTDNTGYPGDNIRLSWKRAYAVKDYLAQQGVAPWRLTVRAYGAMQPAASNDTAEGRGQNRRVELVQIR